MTLPPGSMLAFSSGGIQLYEKLIGAPNQYGGLDYTMQVYGVTGAGVQLIEILPGVTGLFDFNAVNSRVIFETMTTVHTGGPTLPTQQLTNLYGTDGTLGGTQLIANLPNVNGVFNQLTTNNRNIFFTLSYNSDGSQNAAVYGTDGTASGTKVIANLLGGNGTSVLPTAFVADSFDFVFQDLITKVSHNTISYETKIYESDGTPSGTYLEWDLPNKYGVTSLPTPLVSPPSPTTVQNGATANISGIGVLQINTGSQLVTAKLTATHGTLSTSGGLGTISGSGTPTLGLSGTLAQINTDLAGLKFAATSPGAGSISATATFANITSPVATWTVTVTPAPPVVSHHSADQNWTSGQQLAFKLAVDTFSDPQNASLSYAATLSNGAALPSWLTFNAKQETFGGIVPNGTQAIVVKVTATDSYGLSTFETFNVHVASATSHNAIVSSEALQSASPDDAFVFDNASAQVSPIEPHSSVSSAVSLVDEAKAFDAQAIGAELVLAINSNGNIGHLAGSELIAHDGVHGIVPADAFLSA